MVNAQLDFSRLGGQLEPAVIRHTHTTFVGTGRAATSLRNVTLIRCVVMPILSRGCVHSHIPRTPNSSFHELALCSLRTGALTPADEAAISRPETGAGQLRKKGLDYG